MTITKKRASELGILLCTEDCQHCMMCYEESQTLYCEELPENVSIDKAVKLGYLCPELDEDRLIEEMTEEEYFAYRHNNLEIE